MPRIVIFTNEQYERQRATAERMLNTARKDLADKAHWEHSEAVYRNRVAYYEALLEVYKAATTIE